MASLRDNIVAALATKLAVIAVAGGYNTNVSTASGGGGVLTPNPSGEVEYDPSPVLHLYRVSERKRIQEVQYWLCDLLLELVLVPKLDTATPLDERIDDLVEDVERVLFTEKNKGAGAAGNPLDLTYVEDLQPPDSELGHEVLTREMGGVDGEGRIDGARMSVTVRYRHNTTDPRSYGVGG